MSTELQPDAFAKTITIPSAMITTAPLNPEQSAPGMAPTACSRCSIYLLYLVGRTGFEPVTSSVSGLLADLAYVRQGRSRCLWCSPGVAAVALGRPLCRARSGHDLLIRRSGHIVQDHPSLAARWADIPGLSARDRGCPAAWQQSRRDGTDPRPSAFQAGHIPSSRGSCGSYALSPVAAVSRWLLPLLSAAVRYAPYSR
jgi:hypothetical protein